MQKTIILPTPPHTSLTADLSQPIFKRIYFLRIFLAIAICYYHVVWFLNAVYGRHMLAHMNAGRENSTVAVDCFFIMAGFFLAYSFNTTFWEMIKKRLIRLLPAFYISVFFTWIAFLLGANVHFTFKENQTLGSLIINLTLLNFEFKNILLLISWFIYPLFWVSLGYKIIYRYTSNKIALIATCLLVGLSYLLIFDLGIYVWRIVCGLPIGFYRGIGGIGVGILLCYFYNKSAPALEKIQSRRLIGLLGFIEIALIFLLAFLFYFYTQVNPFIIITLFVILFTLSLQNNPFLDRLLGNFIFKKASDFSYMLFMFHATVFGITETLLKYFHLIPSNPFLYLSILMYNALIISAVLHFCLEAPLIKYCKHKFLRKPFTS